MFLKTDAFRFSTDSMGWKHILELSRLKMIWIHQTLRDVIARVFHILLWKVAMFFSDYVALV
jgi:hypothetical protein